MPTVQTNGIETYYEERGEGRPVVFVHAALVDHAMWDEQVAALEDDYRTVVYDVRGHGRTGGSPLAEYSTTLYAADLRALVEALELDRPVLCGLSLGGLIAQTYAATYPDEIAGLVLADTFTPPILTRGEWFLRRVVLNALIPPVRLLGLERVEKANVWLTERFFGGAGGDYEKVEALRAAGPTVTTDEFVKIVRSMTRFHDVTVDLTAISVPTLVVYGEKELPFVTQHAARLAAHLARVDVVEIPGAGHASNLDDPETFTGALRAFLDWIAPVGDGEDVNPETGSRRPSSV
ncbi:Pimeloyl-ACP methyl ester carboxylesterase [Halogranum amylolyticum]|uniref:Pimeloyl-ACP methyl ester carboxylesterase n=1 Tax=Halogranum amylolyticum TaxID=660520 RepID=A0A1H8SHR2_9EURY|nr:alpha/beta hydrolase [Halogranum amylolyticum]SEO77808.1 Pimeloyl-ACP methyl ester carboxylesterase [Halogranum amylolyticum]